MLYNLQIKHAIFTTIHTCFYLNQPIKSCERNVPIMKPSWIRIDYAWAVTLMHTYIIQDHIVCR